MARRLIPKSKLTNKVIKQLIDLFVLEVPALKAAKALDINRHSAERVYSRVRKVVAKDCEEQSILSGEVEVDESYFGGSKKGEIGRRVVSKVPVFGLLKRQGKVYTQIVEDVTRYTLEKIIRGKVTTDSVIYSDSFTVYDGLVVYGYKHYRIYHSENEFARGKNHVNGIESFWSYTKRRMNKFNGIHKSKFLLHLKESEFRFNNRDGNMYKELLKNFRENSL